MNKKKKVYINAMMAQYAFNNKSNICQSMLYVCNAMSSEWWWWHVFYLIFGCVTQNIFDHQDSIREIILFMFSVLLLLLMPKQMCHQSRILNVPYSMFKYKKHRHIESTFGTFIWLRRITFLVHSNDSTTNIPSIQWLNEHCDRFDIYYIFGKN